MKAKLRGIAQVSLALALALSVSLVVAGPVVANTQLPTLSPSEAEYSLDDRAEVMTAITWGVAKTIDAVSDDDGYILKKGTDKDYVVLLRHLIILSSYLEKKLTDIGDDVVLLVKFDTGAVLFTITATGTNPSISPTTGQYDLDKPVDVKTTLTWGAATRVFSIVDGDGYVLKAVSDYDLPSAVDGESTLTIRKSYLQGKIKDIGEAVQLTLSLDVGNSVTFSIMATGTFASIFPATAEYDLDDPADVKATLTWGAAREVESITDGVGYELTPTEYSVTPVDQDRATLTIRKSYFEGKLKEIGKSVVLEFEFDVGNHVSLTVTAKGSQPKLSPPQEEYDLEDPADVEATITWGIAKGLKSIQDGGGYVLKLTADYTLTAPAAGKSTLTIKKSYLEGKLKDVGETVVVNLEFDVGNGAIFTITAEGDQPGLSPLQEEYDLEDPADVETTITWGIAKEVKSIVDGGGYELKLNSDYTLTPLAAGRHTLTFKDSYLKGKLKDIGKILVLTVEFDVGAKATFTINSEGNVAGLFPAQEEYDLDEPDDVEATVTWGAATKVESIVDGDGYRLKATDYTLTPLAAGRHTLTFKDSYLKGKLKDIGKILVLTVEFDVGAKATFTITADGVHAKLSPPQEEYDLDEPADVETTVVWGTANKVESIVDGDGYKLTDGADYSLTPVDADTATLTILDATYVKSKLKDIGESVALTVEFDVGNKATFTIKTEGIQPRLSPPQEEYDLDEPADVKITIVWGTAKEVKSILDGDGYKLKKDTDYSLTTIDAERATLTILDGTYLQKTLTDVGSEAKLTVKFDVGADAILTVAVDGTVPTISPSTVEYDYDDLDDVEATIWYGSATVMKSIVDGDGYKLQEGTDYSLDRTGDMATLIIFYDSYIKGEEMEIGDSRTLTIDFDVNEATLTITAVGVLPSISPAAVEYNILSPKDVATNITWGSATKIVSIVDQHDFKLVEDKHYTVTPVRGGKSTLTILSDEYLKEEITRIRQLRLLTIDFGVSSGHTLEIRAPKIACFIATAAYGTSMADEIQVLRDFRDGYMLTNYAGRALVEFYYSVSPPIAQFISEHASLKAAVRAGLLPAVAMSTVALNTTPGDKMAIAGSLLLVSAALAMWATRRRATQPKIS